MEPLTKMDIAALRRADAVCFDYLPADAEPFAIRCIKSADRDDPFGRDITHRIPVAGRITTYAGGTVRSAFAHLGSAAFHPAWVTLRSLFKVGDEITLEWVADNNNTVLERAALHADALDIAIVRRPTNGKPVRLTFHLLYSICPANTARMVQVEGGRDRVIS